MLRLVTRFSAVLVLASALSGCSATNQLWSPRQVFNARPSADVAAAQAKQPRGVGSLASLFGTREKGSTVDGILALARLNERRGQMENAEQLYRSVMEKNPADPVPYHRLAIMRARQGRFDDADEYFEKALALAPSNPALLSDVGYCRYLESRMDEAEKYLQHAYRLKPTDPAVCNNLAMVRGEQGRYQEAMSLFRQAGSEADAYANLAYVYTQRGELEKAQAAYDQALTLNPELRAAAEAMIQLAQLDARQADQPRMPQAQPPMLARQQQMPAPQQGQQQQMPAPQQGPPLQQQAALETLPMLAQQRHQPPAAQAETPPAQQQQPANRREMSPHRPQVLAAAEHVRLPWAVESLPPLGRPSDAPAATPQRPQMPDPAPAPVADLARFQTLPAGQQGERQAAYLAQPDQASDSIMVSDLVEPAADEASYPEATVIPPSEVHIPEPDFEPWSR